MQPSFAEYHELILELCKILHIRKKRSENIGSLLKEIQKWTKNALYYTSNQKEMIEIVNEILLMMNKKSNLEEINKKIKILKDRILFEEYFE
jgi:hypothetical protein